MGTKTQSSRQAEYFINLVEKVKGLPVMLVIGTLVQVYDRNRHPVDEKDLAAAGSGNYLALCPFHADEELGSFVITPSKNMWYCFTENIGWSGIHFEMRYYELPFKDAVFHLARRFSLISEEEYKKLSGKKIEASVVKKAEDGMKKPQIQENTRVAPEKVINTVYHVIPLVCPLKERHKKHLLKERGLQKDDLGDYFTFPTRNMDLAKAVYRKTAELVAEKKFGKPLRKLNAAEQKWLQEDSKAMKQLRDELIYVPGFYKDTFRDRIEFASYKGIGFIVRDDRGKALGIQIRRDTVKEGESRYVWFSSSFAQASAGCEGGASSGAPGGVIFPEGDPKETAICITEGRFKAEAIAKKGNIAVYVSGVSTWKKILPIVDRLKGDRDKVFIMFDADMMGNTAVHSQIQEISTEMKRHGLTPYIVAWPIIYGKGFDDLVNNRANEYRKYLRCLKYDRFEPRWQKVLTNVLKEFKAERIRDITEKDRAAFNRMMQQKTEEAIFGKAGKGKE